MSGRKIVVYEHKISDIVVDDGMKLQQFIADLNATYESLKNKYIDLFVETNDPCEECYLSISGRRLETEKERALRIKAKQKFEERVEKMNAEIERDEYRTYLKLKKKYEGKSK